MFQFNKRGKGVSLKKSQFKIIMMSFVLVVSIFSTLQNQVQAQHGKPSPVISTYIKMVLAGDISGAAELFKNNPDDRGTKMIKGGFKARFVDQTSSLDLSSIDSEKVRELAIMFQSYWRDALLQKAALPDLNEALKTKLETFLIAEGFDEALKGEKNKFKDEEDLLLENVATFIESEGYFALSGRTPPLLELMIWKRNDIEPQSIELTDGTYAVNLNKLSDFVSYGWSNFATFGMTSTGGWATKEGLYCICSRQNQHSAQYKVTFLKHEGRHFADFGIYPELKPADLEYRAKLTEIIYSEENTYGLTAMFTGGANKIDNAPHPLANWYIVQGLSRKLLSGKTPNDAKAWEQFSKEDIKVAALALLDEHNKTLDHMGAKTVTGTIVP